MDIHEKSSNFVNAVPRNERETSIYMSLKEKNHLLSVRATQIELGSYPKIKTQEIDPLLIAEKELKEGKLSHLMIKRKLPTGKNEYWSVDELII
jgi:DNA-directed RNA polymerase subunit K/omega